MYNYLMTDSSNQTPKKSGLFNLWQKDREKSTAKSDAKTLNQEPANSNWRQNPEFSELSKLEQERLLNQSPSFSSTNSAIANGLGLQSSANAPVTAGRPSASTPTSANTNPAPISPLPADSLPLQSLTKDWSLIRQTLPAGMTEANASRLLLSFIQGKLTDTDTLGMAIQEINLDPHQTLNSSKIKFLENLDKIADREINSIPDIATKASKIPSTQGLNLKLKDLDTAGSAWNRELNDLAANINHYGLKSALQKSYFAPTETTANSTTTSVLTSSASTSPSNDALVPPTNSTAAAASSTFANSINPSSGASSQTSEHNLTSVNQADHIMTAEADGAENLPNYDQFSLEKTEPSDFLSTPASKTAYPADSISVPEPSYETARFDPEFSSDYLDFDNGQSSSFPASFSFDSTSASSSDSASASNFASNFDSDFDSIPTSTSEPNYETTGFDSYPEGYDSGLENFPISASPQQENSDYYQNDFDDDPQASEDSPQQQENPLLKKGVDRLKDEASHKILDPYREKIADNLQSQATQARGIGDIKKAEKLEKKASQIRSKTKAGQKKASNAIKNSKNAAQNAKKITQASHKVTTVANKIKNPWLILVLIFLIILLLIIMTLLSVEDTDEADIMAGLWERAKEECIDELSNAVGADENNSNYTPGTEEIERCIWEKLVDDSWTQNAGLNQGSSGEELTPGEPYVPASAEEAEIIDQICQGFGGLDPTVYGIFGKNHTSNKISTSQELASLAVAIARAESSLNLNAFNQLAAGLFQNRVKCGDFIAKYNNKEGCSTIERAAAKHPSFFTLEGSVAEAVKKYKRAGFCPWDVFRTSGSYNGDCTVNWNTESFAKPSRGDWISNKDICQVGSDGKMHYSGYNENQETPEEVNNE